jgi:hypothetical protein
MSEFKASRQPRQPRPKMTLSQRVAKLAPGDILDVTPLIGGGSAKKLNSPQGKRVSPLKTKFGAQLNPQGVKLVASNARALEMAFSELGLSPAVASKEWEDDRRVWESQLAAQEAASSARSKARRADYSQKYRQQRKARAEQLSPPSLAVYRAPTTTAQARTELLNRKVPRQARAALSPRSAGISSMPVQSVQAAGLSPSGRVM